MSTFAEVKLFQVKPEWWFDNHGKTVGKLLIAPWDMMSGYALEEGL